MTYTECKANDFDGTCSLQIDGNDLDKEECLGLQKQVTWEKGIEAHCWQPGTPAGMVANNSVYKAIDGGPTKIYASALSTQYPPSIYGDWNTKDSCNDACDNCETYFPSNRDLDDDVAGYITGDNKKCPCPCPEWVDEEDGIGGQKAYCRASNKVGDKSADDLTDLLEGFDKKKCEELIAYPPIWEDDEDNDDRKLPFMQNDQFISLNCQGTVCGSGATCRDTPAGVVGGYMCVCDAGYTGDTTTDMPATCALDDTIKRPTTRTPVLSASYIQSVLGAPGHSTALGLVHSKENCKLIGGYWKEGIPQRDAATLTGQAPVAARDGECKHYEYGCPAKSTLYNTEDDFDSDRYDGAQGWSANDEFGKYKTWIAAKFNWFYIGSQDVWIVFIIIVYFSKYSDIKLCKKGDEDQPPEYTDASWFSMLFCSGIGVGLFYWGIAEPVSHYVDGTNRYNSNPNLTDEQVAQDAMNITFFHWGLHGFVVYTQVGLILGIMSYRWG
eukprot:SAG25_NODE_1657_length_2595_cov_1.657051_3_plen_496_part_01